jgi:hypothetical protein
MRAEKGKAPAADVAANERHRGSSNVDAAPFVRPDKQRQCTGRVYIRAQLIGSDRCNAIGFTARGAAPVLQLCRLLVGAGINPDTPLHAYRGDTLCLIVRSIGEAANLELNSKGTAFVRRPQAVRTAPPIAPMPATVVAAVGPLGVVLDMLAKQERAP